MKKELIADVGMVLTMFLFGYAASSKLLNYHAFINELRVSPFYPVKSFAALVGPAVIIIEFSIAGFLIVPRWRLFALYAGVLLLTIFEMYIGSMLLSGLKLPCSCGGVIAQLSWGQHILFNLVFIFVGMASIISYKKNQSATLLKSKEGLHKIFRA